MSEAMRILLLSQFYPPNIGGVERHVQSLGAALAERGHHVAVATFRNPGQAEVEMDGAVKIYRLRGTAQRFGALFSTGRFHAPPLPDPELTLALRRVIKAERPDILHAHNWIVHSSLPLKSWSKAKLVLTLHSCDLTCVQMRFMYMDQVLCSGPGPAKCLRCSVHHYGALKGAVTLAGNELMRGFLHDHVDMFLPVSRAVAEANGLMTHGHTVNGLGAKVQVIPNFVPDYMAGPLRVGDALPEAGSARLDALPGEPFILQVGDLVPDKGIYVLLEAYQRLRPAPPLVLIGRRTPQSPRDVPAGVTVLESLPHNLVMQAWQRSLFGVVPSLCMEAWGMVALEAMSCGRAVIGSRIGGIVDQIIDGETGYLVPPGDVRALSEKMQCLLDDAALRERMGAAARARVREFQASTVVKKIEEVYQSL